jgi:hypothetical protein
MSSTPTTETRSDLMYGAAWIQLAIASCLAKDDKEPDPYRQLNTYLDAPLEPHKILPDTKVIRWWKDHTVVYPTLVKMARDYLAICGSSTALEWQFSSTRHIGTDL